MFCNKVQFFYNVKKKRKEKKNLPANAGDTGSIPGLGRFLCAVEE